MSNSVFLVHDESIKPIVDAWLDRHASASDVHRCNLGRRSLVVVSREVNRSVVGKVFFRGTLVSPEFNAMVFGVRGWLETPARLRRHAGDHEGEHIVADWNRGLRIDRDVFGSARLMYTAMPGVAAASDSLVVLASLRRAVNAPNTPDNEVLIARTAKSGIAGQQISPETVFREIAYLPAGHGLELKQRELGWRVTGDRIADRLSKHRLSYRETVRDGATNVARTVATLAQVPGWSSMLNLSGGYDSRLVFAGIVGTGSTRDYGARIVDHGAASLADVRVARSLAERFGVSAPEDDRPSDEGADQYTLWGASLIGVYDGFGPPTTARRRPRTFELTGIGAEIHKGNWGWRPLPALAEQASEDGPVRDALMAQLAKAAESLGVDAGAGNASEVYYLGYRNGIHGGAGHLGVHMTGVHPVMQLRLAQLGHLRAGTGFRGSPAGIADHTLLLSPEVATHEYDLPARNLSEAYVRDRLAALGGPVTDVTALRVYGHPDDVPDGPSSLSLSISRSIGVDGPITADAVLQRARAAIDLIDDAATRAAYEDVLANTIWRLERHGGSLIAAGISPPRLSTLELLRLAT